MMDEASSTKEPLLNLVKSTCAAIIVDIQELLNDLKVDGGCDLLTK
jgi:hypothetical protein